MDENGSWGDFYFKMDNCFMMQICLKVIFCQ